MHRGLLFHFVINGTGLLVAGISLENRHRFHRFTPMVLSVTIGAICG